MKYRRFTQTDWYGYAGATKFNENSQPFISELILNGGEVYIVADAEGLWVDLYSGYEEVEGPITFQKKWPKPETTSLVAEAELKGFLKEAEMYQDLLSLVYCLNNQMPEAFKGFERIL